MHHLLFKFKVFKKNWLKAKELKSIYIKLLKILLERRDYKLGNCNGMHNFRTNNIYLFFLIIYFVLSVYNVGKAFYSISSFSYVTFLINTSELTKLFLANKVKIKDLTQQKIKEKEDIMKSPFAKKLKVGPNSNVIIFEGISIGILLVSIFCAGILNINFFGIPSPCIVAIASF